MVTDTKLTQERLRTLLDYNPITGIFIWKISRGGRAPKGSIAGCVGKSGHRDITVDQVFYKAHRLAWLYTYGEFPDMEIDHINELPDDNRISNLRLATHQENAHNITSPRSDNNSGYRGVSYDKTRQKWKATINLNQRQIFLGRFDSPEQASNAYLKAKQEYHPTWAEKRP